MRKQLRAKIRRGFAATLTTAMVMTSMPQGGVFAAGDSASDIESGNGVAQILDIGEPEEEKVAVEVFSKYGEIKNIYISREEYEDMYSVDEDEILTYSTETEETETSLAPVKPEWNALPAPSAGKYSFQYADLVNNGDDADNYCILLMGDGYTASEQDKFLQVAQKIADYFMTRVPFSDSDIKTKINIRAVCVVSNVSGVNENDSTPYDTFFQSSFWNNTIERLIVAHNSTRVWEIVEQYMPDAKCPIVIGNSTKYGGSGGSYCTISANESAPDIAFHEFGHTGGGLSDEYWESTYESSNRHESPNRTGNSDSSTCRWSDLVGVNGVGLYSFSEAGVTDWYRPHQSCEMRYLNQQYCEVCKRHIRSVIKGVTDNAVPSNAVISNAAQLQDYCQRVNNGASTTGKTVTLSADITLSGTGNLACMKTFKGVFDGNGHTISNINMTSSDGNFGFIGELSSTGIVKNLHLNNVYVQGGGYHTGGLVGNCKGEVYGCSVSGTVRGSDAVGGIAGGTESGANIHDNYNLANVYASAQVAGGVAGWATGGTINNNYSMGDITSDQAWKGSIVGYQTDTTCTNNYYLNGKQNTSGIGDAKSSTEFADGTVTSLLNSVNNIWKQGASYPVHSFSSTTIEETTTTSADVTYDAFDRIEAEKYSSNSGTVIDTNSSASGGYNIGGVTNNTSITFNKINFTEAASSISFYYSSPSGTGGNIEVYCDDNKVGAVATVNNGSSWSTYSTLAGRLSTQIAAGTHKITLKFITSSSYTCNLDYFNFIRANGDTTAPAGYTFCQQSSDATWHTIGAWSYYLGTWNNSVGYYKGGTEANDFTLQIANNDKAMWGIQVAMNDIAVQDGHNYTYTINMTSTAAGTIIHKEDISNSGDNSFAISSGNNTITGTFTASGTTAKILMELASGIDAGTELQITGYTLKDNTQETTTSEDEAQYSFQDGTLNNWVTVGDWGLYFGDWNGTASCRYATGNNKAFVIKADKVNKGAQWLIQSSYTQDAKDGHTYRVTANVTLSKAGSIGIKEDLTNEADNPVYTDIAANQATNLVGEYAVTGDKIKVMFELGTGIEEGTLIEFNSIKIEDITVFDPVEATGVSVSSPKVETISVTWSQSEEAIENGQKYNVYVDGVKKLSSVSSGTYTITGITGGTHNVKVTGVLDGKETSGVEVQVQVKKKLEDGIEIYGFQINGNTKGIRTIYNVDSEIDGKSVTESGLIYSLEGYALDSDMVVGSSNSDVHSYASTSNGLYSGVLADSDIASTRIMTMKFADRTQKELTINWKIRAYAKLSDGSYKYTDVVSYKIYDIADEVYQNSGMPNATLHNYLHTDILTKVNANYQSMEYKPNN